MCEGKLTVTFYWQDRLSFVMEQLSDASMLKVVKEKIEKRKKQRQWMKNRRERRKKEMIEAIDRRNEISKQVDEEREVIQMKIACEKRVTRNH